MAATGLPVYVHAPYLINPGSPAPATRERSAAALGHSLRRAREIGALGVVVHTGSAVDGDREAGLRRARACLLPVLDSIGPEGPDVLLEPMAGQGSMLCASAADLGPYLAAVDWHPRAGVCLDTCHMFAAGHDLAARDGPAAMLSEFSEMTAGAGAPRRLRLIHANDSKDACGSRRDRHEHIGRGQIGEAAFRSLLRHPATAGTPFICETPGRPEQALADDVTALKRMRDQT